MLVFKQYAKHRDIQVYQIITFILYSCEKTYSNLHKTCFFFLQSSSTSNGLLHPVITNQRTSNGLIHPLITNQRTSNGLLHPLITNQRINVSCMTAPIVGDQTADDDKQTPLISFLLLQANHHSTSSNHFVFLFDATLRGLFATF